MTENAIDNIACLVGEGQLVEAESLCRNALFSAPDDINLLGLMGTICIARDKPEQAIPHLRKIMAREPGNTTAIRALAAALDKAGQVDEADTLRNDYMQSLPTDKLLVEAEVLVGKGNTAEAEKICDVVLLREPESNDALRVLAMAAVADERFVIAEAFLNRIVRLAPDDIGGIFELARFLGDRGRFAEAVRHLQPALAKEPDNPDLQLLLAGMLSALGDTEASMAAYDHCLDVRPDEPSALLGRGHMLRIAGRQDDAHDSYRHCVAISPEIGSAWWYLSSLPRFEATDDDISTMFRQLDKQDFSDESRVGFHFALARAFEKRDDYEAAWAQYVLGNSAKRQIVSYDPVESELSQRKIRDTYTRTVIEGAAAQPSTSLTPIFVLGLPRSGSTLIEQILAAHSLVEGTGELPYILMMTKDLVSKQPGALHYTEFVRQWSDAELTQFGNSYLDLATTHCNDEAPFFTDKMPANYPHVGFILQILPHAKIIDARRDPMACCVANYRQLFAQGKNQSYDLGELGEYYVEYVKTMEHWDDVAPGTVLRVDYESVVDDFDNQVHRILDFCGLPFEDACLEFYKSARPVNTASAEQVREPIYRSAVEFWRHYEGHLDSLCEVLEPVL